MKTPAAFTARAIAPKLSLWPDPADRHSVLPKRTRASKPKVRTGCVTCKRRRVKCDEARPTCEKCQRSRVTCDGYENRLSAQSPPAPKPANKPPALAPRPVAGQILLPHLPLRSNPPTTKFDGDDVPYFDFFCHQLTQDLSGHCYSDFWPRIVLCEAMTSDCVRGAVLAIGALSQAVSRESDSRKPGFSSNKPSVLSPWTSKRVVNDDHRVALRYYVKALSLFRKHLDVEVNISSPRSVVIMSLLFITFELLQSNMKAVDSLMTSAIELLKGSLKLYRRDNSLLPGASRGRQEEDMDDIEHMLPFLSIMGGFTPYLKSQQLNMALWDSSAGDAVPNLGPLSVTQLQSWWNQFFARACAFMFQAFLEQLRGHFVDGDAVVRKQQAFLSQLDRWRAVLDMGFARATTAGDDRAKRALQLIQLQRIQTCICLKCCTDKTEMAWDAYEDDFLVLFERCLAFVAEARPDYRAGFTLNMGILSLLGPIIVKCRNHETRMRAFELARRMPWREGAWDAEAEVFGKMGGLLLEERGRDASGFVSAENRWSWIGGDWDMKRRVLTGRYLRSVPDEQGDPVVTELELDLDTWPDVCAEASCTVDHAEVCSLIGLD